MDEARGFGLKGAPLLRTIMDIEGEAMRARKLFPDPAGVMTALVEEVGELAKAYLDEPWECVEAEAIQVAAMAIRVLEEGDPTLTEVREKRRKEDG